MAAEIVSASASGTDRRQQFFRVVGQQDEHAVAGGLFQHLQQRILAGDAHILRPGKEVDLVFRLVGTDVDVISCLADQIHRHGLFFGVVDGDKIRVGIGHDLPAGLAAQTGSA